MLLVSTSGGHDRRRYRLAASESTEQTTMSSDLVSKPGWFDSLRRQKNKPKKPLPPPPPSPPPLLSTSSPLSPAKSLSSLNSTNVVQPLNGPLHTARSTNAINSVNQKLPPKLPPRSVSTSSSSKLGWRSLLHLNKSKSPSVDREIALPAVASTSEQCSTPKTLPVSAQSAFFTLPRKRPDHVAMSQSTSMDAFVSRSRSYSTVVPDRPKKRSTVWYTQSDSNVILNKNNRKQLKDEIAEVTAEMESMDNGEESKNAARAKQLSLGRKKFNMDPKKGIEFLVQQGLLQNTPQDIAAFLYRGEGLSKTAIGDYLGEKSPFHEQVLKAFVDLHDFTDLILVQALRQFLWSFRLPGEAQKIDRMMETFAQRYCQLNPNIFSNPDTCYVLSFAVIILNTSLHNPSVKEKPTLERFIAMNRGINDGKDLPRDILESLYESIKAEPFKIPEDDGNDLMHTFFNPDREGWLWKQGGRYKSWKRRWFILNDNCLYYFEYTTDKEPRGIIPLENIQVREVVDRHKPNCFELYATGGNEFIKACKTDSEGKVVEGKHTVYRMSAAEQSEKDEWIACIRQSISHNPFYDMLAARKKKAQKSSHRAKP